MTSERFSLKIAGASGQGINVIGEIINKGLKRSGYGTFAYREYPSLIKGGHATYQIDITSEIPLSSEKKLNLVVILNRQATRWHINELKENAYILHDIDNPRINLEEYTAFNNVNAKLIYVPAFQLSKEQGGNELTANIVILGSLWRLLGLEESLLKEIVEETFKDKPKLLEADLKCAQIGFSYNYEIALPFTKRLIKENEVSAEDKIKLHIKPDFNKELFAIPTNGFKDNYLLSGNETISLGAISAGVSMYYSYPMTPSSSILTFLAERMEQTGMIVKQAEDEITVAAMAIGSMHMGARALVGTSGGGFDLMTEHISLAASIEVPFVCILGQRPGPATGMPTWTTQGDLMLSIFSSHGEFTRCVIAPKDAEDAFYAIQEAFNIAERYQIPVIVLTDKLLAESVYSVHKLDVSKIPIDRGELILDENQLSQLKSTDRYSLNESGIAKRWLPGSKAANFNANSDEHDEEGNVTEDAEMASKMIQKRLNKENSLLVDIPEPEVYSNNVKSQKILKIISWGSTFGVINDAMQILAKKNIRVENLHYKYLWPLKTDRIKEFADANTIIIEGNHNSQLSELIRMKSGIDLKNKILKWDGRPFFVDELVLELLNYT